MNPKELPPLEGPQLTRSHRPHSAPLVTLLVTLLVALAAILAGINAPVQAAVAAGTRVGAHTPATQVVVGPDDGTGAGKRLENNQSAYDFALATGVAAKSGLRMPGVLRVGDVKLAGVPKGAVGTPVQTGRGLEYTIPRGTPELDPRVAGIRIMDPVTSGKYQNPSGYAVYMNQGGQTVNPLTGQTIAPPHPFAHIPLP